MATSIRCLLDFIILGLAIILPVACPGSVDMALFCSAMYRWCWILMAAKTPNNVGSCDVDISDSIGNNDIPFNAEKCHPDSEDDFSMPTCTEYGEHHEERLDYQAHHRSERIQLRTVIAAAQDCGPSTGPRHTYTTMRKLLPAPSTTVNVTFIVH
uniref:Secreted protein n=1 Tax=Panagrellus redivivus TaxID=6233 RepID=A0A7E4VE39_PANRE